MEGTDYNRRRLSTEARRRITDKLLRGQESAARLQIILGSAEAAATTEHKRRTLAAEILSSFTDAISVLDSSESASCTDHSLCSDLDSGYSRRNPAVKDLGRGNKRRKLANTRTVTAATTEDGHAWRKYGQKAIHNTTYPKSYYRCTHKYAQGCLAVKHVQRMEGDSKILYKITYISDHTCAPASPIATSVAATPSDSCNLVCFSDSRNDQLTEGTDCSFFWASDTDAAKVGETAIASGVTDETDLWSELNDFGGLLGMTNQSCFFTGDDADSYMFLSDF